MNWPKSSSTNELPNSPTDRSNKRTHNTKTKKYPKVTNNHFPGGPNQDTKTNSLHGAIGTYCPHTKLSPVSLFRSPRLWAIFRASLAPDWAGKGPIEGEASKEYLYGVLCQMQGAQIAGQLKGKNKKNTNTSDAAATASSDD